MPRVVLFATFAEANGALERNLGRATCDQALYTFGEDYLLITGMGALAAASSLSRFLQEHKVDEIWNLGIAGALNRQPLASCHSVQTVSKHLPFPLGIDAHSRRIGEALFPPISLSCNEGVSLITTDWPLHQQHSVAADLVDMEGYGIAHAAQQAGIELKMWKWVSDFSAEGGADQITAALPQISQRIGDWLYVNAGAL
jgi:adenosylhomocysteine nucleosidase